MPDMLTFTTYFAQNPGVFWVILSVGLILVEVMMPGIGGLFSAVAALTVAALLILEIVIPDSFMEQLAYFLGFTIFWAAALWRPMQKLLQPEGSYSDIVGTRGVVEEGGLEGNKIGTVKWSGVNMQAQIAQESDVSSIAQGDDVWIVGKDGMVLLVDTKKPEENSTDNSAK